MLPPGCNAVPPEVLKIFHCKCLSDEPCASNNCSCSKNKLSCSIFCSCYDETCFNPWTFHEEGQENVDREEVENEQNEE